MSSVLTPNLWFPPGPGHGLWACLRVTASMPRDRGALTVQTGLGVASEGGWRWGCEPGYPGYGCSLPSAELSAGLLGQRLFRKSPPPPTLCPSPSLPACPVPSGAPIGTLPGADPRVVLLAELARRGCARGWRWAEGAEVPRERVLSGGTWTWGSWAWSSRSLVTPQHLPSTSLGLGRLAVQGSPSCPHPHPWGTDCPPGHYSFSLKYQ